MNRTVAIVQSFILVVLFSIFYVFTPSGLLWQSLLASIAGLVGGLFFNKELFDLLEAFLRRVLVRFRRPPPFRAKDFKIVESGEIVGDLLSNLPHRGAELWVVLSSKGGVGKSMVSLGITELLSRDGSTLLIDFDLQNRGLTSLLNKAFEYESSVMSLMREFSQFLEKHPDADSRIPRILDCSKKELPNGFAMSDFNAIVAGFAVDRPVNQSLRPDYLNPRVMEFNKLAENALRPPGTRLVNLENAFFLCSRSDSPDEEFLFSDIARRGLAFFVYFLKSLCALAGNRPVSKIVLDCHGAHDMLTAGAILAADKTIVVSTTDPGCYEGTMEILKAVNSIPGQGNRNNSVVYVVNRVGTLDTRVQEIRDLIEKRCGKKDIVEIPELSELREVPKNYRFGAILENQVLSGKLELIRDFLVAGRSVETGTAATRWVAPDPSDPSISANSK